MSKRIGLVITLSFLLSLGACTQKNDEMQEQLLQHDAQLRRMQPVQADVWNNVQALREEVNDLKGQIADLRNAGGATLIVEKLNRHEQALHQIETSMAMNFNLDAPSTATQKTAAPVQSPFGAPAIAPTTPEQTTSTAASSTPSTEAAAATAGATAGATGAEAPVWGQETPREKAPAAQKDMSIALFEAGVNAFNARNYANAQRSFNDFMSNYPSHKNIPAAQYYIAECYFQKGQFPDAALAYDTVITKYASSSKAPASYLKQGICFGKMKQAPAAQARMQELIKKYPSSPEAKRAKDYLKNNK